MEGFSNSTSIPRPKAPCENLAKEGQFCSSAKLGQQLSRLSSKCHPMMSVAVARLHNVSEVACQTKSSAAVNRTWGILQHALCSTRSRFFVLGVGRAGPWCCWRILRKALRGVEAGHPSSTFRGIPGVFHSDS